jgi:hypothetical protein
MPITRLLRGPRTAARGRLAIVCAALALEAEIAERHFENEAWAMDMVGLPEFIGRAANDGCRGLVSFGVAGGLSPDVRSGDVVVASAVIGQGERIPTDDAWSAWLLSAIPTAVYGPVFGVDFPIPGGALRGELGRRSGALVADMESHVIARMAAASALRFVAVRVVIDAAGRNVPPTALACVSNNGETSRWRLSRLLLERPSDAVDVMRLGADWWLARRALLKCCDVLGASLCVLDL